MIGTIIALATALVAVIVAVVACVALYQGIRRTRERMRLQRTADMTRDLATEAAADEAVAEGESNNATAERAEATTAIDNARAATPPQEVTQAMLDRRAAARVAADVATNTFNGARERTARTQREANAAARAYGRAQNQHGLIWPWVVALVAALLLAAGAISYMLVFEAIPAAGKTSTVSTSNSDITTPATDEPAATAKTTGGDSYFFFGDHVGKQNNTYNTPPAKSTPRKKTAKPATPTCEELLKKREAIDKQLEGMSCKTE